LGDLFRLLRGASGAGGVIPAFAAEPGSGAV
jgi:hypothetical protein